MRSLADYLGVRRAFEIWPTLQFASLMRGLGNAGRHGQHNVSGVLGVLNMDGGVKRIGRNPSIWRVTDRDKLFARYPGRDLPPSGIAAARRFSAELAKKQSVLDPHPDLFPERTEHRQAS